MSETVTNNNGKEFKVIQPDEINNYISRLTEIGAREVLAEKSGAVIARQVTAEQGEDIEVYTKNGNHEATEHADAGKWILTRADIETGQPVLDDYSHENSWVTDEKTVHKKYDMDNISETGFVKPKGGEQYFIQIQEDIAVYVSWGENGSLIMQYLESGAYLNITDMEDVYGIAEEEFC